MSFGYQVLGFGSFLSRLPAGVGDGSTGGSITTHGAFRVHTFNSSGTFGAENDGFIDVIRVAGGGAGGKNN